MADLSRVLVGFWAALTLCLPPLDTYAQSASGDVRSVDFDECQEKIRVIIENSGIIPATIVDTDDYTVVNFPVAGGNVMIACSRQAGTMTITQYTDDRSPLTRN